MATQVEIGKADEFGVGVFKIVTINGREFGTVRLPNGEFRTVRNACPHKAAPICQGIVGGTWLPSAPGKLEFAMAGEVLVCPWHGYEYDLNTGQEMFVPRPSKMRLFPTEVRDGVVVVTIA